MSAETIELVMYHTVKNQFYEKKRHISPDNSRVVGREKTRKYFFDLSAVNNKSSNRLKKVVNEETGSGEFGVHSLY